MSETFPARLSAAAAETEAALERLLSGVPRPGEIARPEALLAAIYLDGGIRPARAFALRTLSDEIKSVIENRHPRNYKSLLQQHTQKNMDAVPVYKISKEEGPDHLKTFEAVAMIGGKKFGHGSGATKKDAEQNAARNTLEMIA